jgi:hypothetical protein
LAEKEPPRLLPLDGDDSPFVVALLNKKHWTRKLTLRLYDSAFAVFEYGVPLV